jgi:hypothetical protein
VQTPSGTWHRALTGLLVIAGLGFFATQFPSLPNFSIDDAYITFSFSKNVALGNGPVFSHGARVEGYSNFLWMILVALPLAVRSTLSPVVAARWLCAPCAVLLFYAVYRTLRSVTGSCAWAVLGLALLGGCSDLGLALLSGLETFAYTALVTVAFALEILSRDNPRYRAWTPWVLLSVALMRIDGFIPLFFVLGWRFLSSPEPRLKALGALARSFGPPVGIYATWFGWRFLYYGLPLPSTYYAKSRVAELLPKQGLDYVTTELRDSRLVWVVAAMGVLLWMHRRELVSAIVFVTVHLVYVVTVGGDWMPFARFVLPVVPLMICLIVAAAADAMRALGRTPLPVRGLALMGLLSGFVAIWLGLDHRLVNGPHEDGKMNFAAEQISHIRKLRRAAELLALAAPPGSRFVTDYAGIFGYYTDSYVIDMWGLATPMIAIEGDTEGVNPIYGKACARCYPELRPEFFHTVQPLVRQEDSFTSSRQVIDAVWQSGPISRYLDLASLFIVGRVRDVATKEAAFFLERKRPGVTWSPRSPRPGIVIDYPFG